MGRLRLGQTTTHECRGHGGQARSVAWNSTGARLASASVDTTAKLWNLDGSGQGREITTLKGHEGNVERVRWHPTDPNILCTAAMDRTVLLWDVRTPPFQKIVKIQLINKSKDRECVASVEWHPDGSLLAIAEKDNQVHIYDVRKTLSSYNKPPTRHSNTRPPNTLSKPVRTFNLKPDILNECHFSPAGQHMVAATKTLNSMGTLQIWPSYTSEMKTITTLVGHTGPIYCLKFSPCKRFLATGGFDALVGLWDTSEMVCTATISRMTKFIRSVSFSHDSNLLAVSNEERWIDIANAQTGEEVGRIEAINGADELAWHPKSYALAYASGSLSEKTRDRVPHVAVVKISVHES